jgi:hypothetical protein
MALDGALSMRHQATHIELNLGNIFAIGLLSLLWYGVAAWSTNYLARTDIPGISQLAIGGQSFLHAA